MKKLILVLTLIIAYSTQAQWQLVWQDEFNYTGLPDPAKWGYDAGVLNLNAEVQNYAANRLDNARVENGNLIIEARRDWYQGTEYSSARMVSRNKGDWKYGRIEVRAKIPVGQGLWPAIWMLPTDWKYGGWPRSGEIDIMESFALGGLKYDKVEANIHTEAYNHTKGTNKGAAITGLSNIEQNFHTYGVSWYVDRMVFDVDGREYFTFRNEGNIAAWPYDQRFHLILNIAVGGMLGSWIDPNIFPKRMTIDYIRVYQQGTGPVSTTGPVTVYKDCNYSGFSTGLGVGDYNLAKMKELNINDDDISSLRITQGYKAILYQDDNFTGASTVINSDNNCLNTTWNDKVTSIKIVPNGLQGMDGTYYLRNKESGLFMDAAGGEAATTDGVNIHQWAATNTKNQQFKFNHLGDGAYKITLEHSGKVLDIDGIKTENKANAQQWTYFGSNNQKFIVVPADDYHFKLVAMHSGRILEVANASHDQQANVQQYDNNNQACGQWKFLPTNAVTGNGTGLRANYFNGNNFNTPILTRVDEKVDFNWGANSPDASLPNNDFSTRWTGQIQAKYDGEYTFYLNADDGRRLWIDGQIILENWNAGSYETTGKKTLSAGQKVNIRLDYYEGGGDAQAHLSWSTNLFAKEIVPKSQLYPNNLPTVTITKPSNASAFNTPASVVIEAAASDNGGSVDKVEFYNGNTLLSSDGNAPYSYTWNNVTANNYVITARVYDNQGAVNTSAPVNFTVSNITGADDYFEEKMIEFYPNPVSNFLFIKSKDKSVQVTIYDLAGKIILSEMATNNGVNVSTINAGLYTVEIKTEHETIVEKLIKK